MLHHAKSFYPVGQIGFLKTTLFGSIGLMIFFFIWTWNEFFIPLVMLTTPASQTVPIALSSLQGDRLLDVPTLNAGALVSLVPTLLFFLFFQRTLTRGVTAGAVK